ncbi:hypothetical protein O7606_17435 [Micromonospora sp. WMMD882]|uniref:hypothetical protein n=1 Tax=Micromonospora sp. WMMD882 TaxID=3015151 RepID=UPI00248BF7E1|nr:hypothetical protein [Micromonospora sp. WMMD882]WBB78028.1 hypothetical protein O7606_17435 [Micromonospora sp. WMMD882]
MTRQDTDAQTAIGRVTTGMTVLDATGAEVGTVDLVQRGDPNAVTVQAPGTEAPTADPGSSLDELIESAAVEEPDVPADLAARLLRTGYLKVAGPDGAVYALADQIAAVADGQVRLTVPAADLTPEE